MVSDHQYVCEVDGEIICPGYWTAIGIKVCKIAKKSVADVKFIRNKDEIEFLQNKNARNQFYDPMVLSKK